MSHLCFSALNLRPASQKNLAALGYEQMTPVQAQSLPAALQGKDLLAKAQTGSGKTAAFGIALIERLQHRHFGTQALVLCPTRELADQVAKELRKLARATANIKILSLCGGTPFGPQLGSLQHGAHIVVGTPGRIQQHLRKGSLKLESLKTLVLDEADRMLDMGFRGDIDNIVEHCPSKRQTLLFSATYPPEIQKISRQLQHQPITVTVESQDMQLDITQHFFEIDKAQRLEALLCLLQHYRPQSAVIFCSTKQQTEDVAHFLRSQGLPALAIHGDLEQKERDQVLVSFANLSCSFLVATDVAARGLDVKELPAVINFQLSRDPEVHVHRIGRTGRAGLSGLALSLVSASEAYKLNALEDYCQQSFSMEPLPRSDTDDLSLSPPPMVTLQIDGGRKNKIRPGDILGALTGQNGIPGKSVGKIDIYDFHAYVAIESNYGQRALQCLQKGKIKGRACKVRKLKLGH